MPSHSFDQLIRDRLSALILAPLEGDWHTLVELLDASFDACLKEKIETYHTFPDTGAWQWFVNAVSLHVDEVIGAKLASLEAEMPADAWALLQAKLDGQMVEATMIAKLSDHQPEMLEADWQALQRSLEPDALWPALQEKFFAFEVEQDPGEWESYLESEALELDRQIGARLEEFPPASESEIAHAWSQFVPALDGNGLDQQIRETLATHQVYPLESDWLELLHQLEQPFDHLVHEKLRPLHVSLPKHGWNMMVKRLEAEGIRSTRHTRPLWLKRSLAAAITLLFMLTGSSWWLTKTKPEAPISGFISKHIVAPLKGEQVQPPLVNEAVDQPEEAFASQTAISPPSTSSSASVNEEDDLESTVQIPSPSSTAQLIAVNQAPLNSELSITLGVSPQPKEFDPNKQQIEVQAPTSRQYVQPYLNRLPNYTALAFASNPQAERSLSVPLPQQSTRMPDISLGLFGAYATTKAELNDDARRGFQYGLRAEVHLTDHVSLVTGLLYGKKRFAHNYFFEDDSSSLLNRRRLEGELTVADFPLMLRYRFTPNDGLTLYTQAGIITTISISENYQSYNPNSSPNSRKEVYQPEQLNADEITGTGFNTYPGNILVAIGLEYEINQNLGFYAEPYFLQHLQRTKGSESHGLRKRLYSSGVGLGLRYRFRPNQESNR